MMSDFRGGWGGQGKSDNIGQGRGVDKQKSDVLSLWNFLHLFLMNLQLFLSAVPLLAKTSPFWSH